MPLCLPLAVSARAAWLPSWSSVCVRVCVSVVARRGEPASAVSLHEHASCAFGPDNTFKYASSGPGWVQGNQDLRYGVNTPFNARGAIQAWAVATSVNGGTQGTQEALGDVVVTFEALNGDEGLTSCAGGTLKLDTKYRDQPNNVTLASQMRGLLYHETGHALGLDHVGRGGPVPTVIAR
jgi:hypothetical protein